MHNMIYLIGRINNEYEFKDNKVEMEISVPRAFKNEEGIYEVDIIPVRLFNTIAEHTAEYCKKGDLIGIKGRLQTLDNQLVVVADKISFLASNKTN